MFKTAFELLNMGLRVAHREALYWAEHYLMSLLESELQTVGQQGSKEVDMVAFALLAQLRGTVRQESD